jgi:hypothetical protein
MSTNDIDVWGEAPATSNSSTTTRKEIHDGGLCAHPPWRDPQDRIP